MNDTGMTSARAGRTLRAKIGSVTAGTYRRGGRTCDVRVKLADSDGSDQLKSYTVSSRDGRPIQYSSMVDFKKSTLPSAIDRRDKTRVVRVYADPARGVALGDLAREVESEAAKLLPPSYIGSFTGQVEKMQETTR